MNKPKIMKFIGAILALLAVIALAAHTAIKIKIDGMDKARYGDLQAVESTHRNLSDEIINLKYKNKDVVGILNKNGSRVWLYLKYVDKNGDFLVLSADGLRQTPCRKIQEIFSKNDASALVKSAAMKQCLK